MHVHTNTHIKHACTNLAIVPGIQLCCSLIYLCMCVYVCVCGRLHACFFVGLIKADTVQSRGLGGEIKILLPPWRGGGK